MTELCRIGELYHTDKVIGGYTEFYHTLFENRRDFKKVMEVGIGTLGTMKHVKDYLPGASLFMWRDYFPDAEIYGLDIDPFVLVNDGRIHSIRCDQRDVESLKAAGQWAGDGFDLVLDDGDHMAEYQWNTFQQLFSIVRPGGFYIIEDAGDHVALSTKLTECHYQHSIVFAVNGTLTGKLILVRK